MVKAYRKARPELIDATSTGDSGRRFALVNGKTSALDGCTGTARSGDGGRLRPSGLDSGDGLGGSSERLPRNLMRGTRRPDDAAAATAAAAGAACDDAAPVVCAGWLEPLGASASSSVKSGLPTSTFSSSWASTSTTVPATGLVTSTLTWQQQQSTVSRPTPTPPRRTAAAPCRSPARAPPRRRARRRPPSSRSPPACPR
ncbi:unnamed protein product [Phytophthora lilii]|uniref:Unnamed protein product n=1 Tax=Phytophthora lilii TaxID=2077276 RepID=A0A9W6X3I4_9STRA|nr:unnamed protein product [Phytophthora lilii]